MTTAPFLLVTELTWWDDEGAGAQWCPTGREFGPSSEADRPSRVPGTLVLEALTQCAGLFLRQTHTSPGSSWMLTGVDDSDVDHLRWGRELTLTCTVRRRSAHAAVLAVSAATEKGEVCHAMILMHRV